VVTTTRLTRAQIKTLFLSSLGGIIEFYDFIIYIFLVNVIEKLFFPSSSEFVTTLKTLAVFSISYLIRPLGGVIFSHFGDRYGRKTVFLLTILLMAIPSIAIALLPTAAQIGIIAPILLLVFRILQGLALGGEIPASITFISEHVNEQQRAFATSILFFAINLGLLLGSSVTALMNATLSTEALYTYGWRILFFLGGILGLLSIFLRRSLQETSTFSALPKNDVQRIPLIALLQHSWLNVLQGALLVALGSVSIFLYLYWPHYLNEYEGINITTAFNLNTVGILILNFSIVTCGWLADKFGSRTIYAIGAISIIILTYPLFLLFGMSNLTLIAISYIVFSLLFGFITGAYPALLSSLFPTPVRYSGIAMSYNIAFALFAGLSPIICTVAIHTFHSPLAPGFYLITIASLALIACRLGQGRSGTLLPESEKVLEEQLA